MITLNLFQVLIELIQIYFFQVLYLFWSFFCKIFNLNNNLLDNLIFAINLQLDIIINYVSNYLLQFITVTSLKYARGAIYVYRELAMLRFIISYFPSVNTFRGLWPILTEPVDIILRPLHKAFPKIPYFDIAGWFFFFVLDISIRFIDFLIRTERLANLSI